MLPEFYLEYLKTYLPSSEFLTLQILVWLLHKKGDKLIITIDRTQWKLIIFQWRVSFGRRELCQYIGYFYRRRVAVTGSSNFYEQVATIRPVLKLLKDYKLVVIGDREYRSTAFAAPKSSIYVIKKNSYLAMMLCFFY